MNQGRLVFAQLTQHLPLTTFRRESASDPFAATGMHRASC